MQALNKVHYKRAFNVPFVTFPHCSVVSFFFFLGLIVFYSYIKQHFKVRVLSTNNQGVLLLHLVCLGKWFCFPLGGGQDSIFTLHPRVKLKSQSSYLSWLSAGTTGMCRHTRLPLNVWRVSAACQSVPVWLCCASRCSARVNA